MGWLSGCSTSSGSSLSDDFRLSPSPPSLYFLSLELNYNDEVIEVPPISPYFLFSARWVKRSTVFSSSNYYRCGSSAGKLLSGLDGTVPEFKCRFPVPPVCPCSLVPELYYYLGVLALANYAIVGLSFYLCLSSSSFISSYICLIS